MQIYNFFFILSFFYLNNRSIKKEKEELLITNDLTSTTLRPHLSTKIWALMDIRRGGCSCRGLLCQICNLTLIIIKICNLLCFIILNLFVISRRNKAKKIRELPLGVFTYCLCQMYRLMPRCSSRWRVCRGSNRIRGIRGDTLLEHRSCCRW